MRKIFWRLIICFSLFWNFGTQVTVARQIKPEPPPAIISCFSGGREILRKTIISGPLADEYKFAHEIKVKDDIGVRSINFSGGLCIIDRGEVSMRQQLPMSDKLSCYSGRDDIVTFEVYGRESTVDEYVEGRTFIAKAEGKDFDSESLHEYLVFGTEACIGEESG